MHRLGERERRDLLEFLERLAAVAIARGQGLRDGDVEHDHLIEKQLALLAVTGGGSADQIGRALLAVVGLRFHPIPQGIERLMDGYGNC